MRGTARGARAHVHDRARHRGCRGRDQALAPHRGRARPRSDRCRHAAGSGGDLIGEQPAAVDRPREGRDPPRHGGARQRGLGPVRKGEGKPLWKLLVDMSPEQLVGLHRLPLHERRADAGRRRWRSCKRAGGDEAPSARPRCSARLPGLHDLGRLARLLGREAAGLCREASRPGWTRIKMKVGAGDRGRPPPGRDRPRGDRAGPPSDDGRQPGLGGECDAIAQRMSAAADLRTY